MESLLKLSGLLSEEDGDRTDLGTLEKRLADKTMNQSNGGTPVRSPGLSETNGHSASQSDSHHNTPQQERRSRRQTSPNGTASPKGQKEGEAEVEALSDMMCSLVTNNCGETRYIGRHEIHLKLIHDLTSP